MARGGEVGEEGEVEVDREGMWRRVPVPRRQPASPAAARCGPPGARVGEESPAPSFPFWYVIFEIVCKIFDSDVPLICVPTYPLDCSKQRCVALELFTTTFTAACSYRLSFTISSLYFCFVFSPSWLLECISPHPILFVLLE